MEKLTISTDNDEDSDSEAEYRAKCGLIYEESSIKWICCNHCNTWMDISCAGVSKSNTFQRNITAVIVNNLMIPFVMFLVQHYSFFMCQLLKIYLSHVYHNYKHLHTSKQY